MNFYRRALPLNVFVILLKSVFLGLVRTLCVTSQGELSQLEPARDVLQTTPVKSSTQLYGFGVFGSTKIDTE